MTDPARPTIEEILARRKPRTDSVWVPIDTDLQERIADTERRLTAAKQADDLTFEPGRIAPLEAELAALEAEADLVSAEFTFQELPRPEFRKLIAANPPEPGGAVTRWNEDTFAPALVAACCIDPVMTLEQAETIWASWSEATTFLLFGKAWEVNEGKVKVPFSRRSTGKMRGSPQSSTSASETDEPSSTPSS